MDKNKLFDEKIFFEELAMGAPWKKFGQKMKNFETFFDIIDSQTCTSKKIQNFSLFGQIFECP